jgi:2-methylcitrate dehydratase
MEGNDGRAMSIVEDLAAFVVRSSWQDLSTEIQEILKARVLDSIGCAIGALDEAPVRMIREQISDFGGRDLCSMIGGGRTAPDLAALHNSAAVRYLDFNDSYLAKGETCHPSDNIAAVLAAGQYRGASGKDLLAGIAVAYQVQCRLSDEAPVRARGFDHTVQGAYGAAAGVAKMLTLDEGRTANAIAIAGTSLNALRVTRTGALSQWKGMAAPWVAFGAAHVAFLAMRGVTGPREVFEGNKGFMDAIAGRFEVDWSKETLDRVARTVIKKFNAEIHSQSALEAALELKRDHGLEGQDVERVEIEIFDVAYDIIGGGEEGDKTVVRTKEEADHSLQYLVAVALLDGEVLPRQYEPDRIGADDVQSLLRRIEVRPDDRLSARFPQQHACRVLIRLRDGRVVSKDKEDYEGYHTRPVRWETLVEKFERLSEGRAGASLRKEIVEAVEGLEDLSVRDLTDLLERVDGR